MEYPWNIHGISMEYPWNIHGINGWRMTVIWGNLWKSESDEPSKFDLIWGIWIFLDKLLD